MVVTQGLGGLVANSFDRNDRNDHYAKHIKGIFVSIGDFMSEDREEYITDAAAMIGKGYDSPSLEIEPARTVIERRNGKMQEVERAAFVKVSTAFKDELKNIDEVALKVWLFIALSINRNTDEANPGLRAIHNGTGFAVNTIRDAIDRLEHKYGLLVYEKGSGKSANIYTPLAFVSAKNGVSPTDTQPASVSVENPSVSVAPVKSVQPDLTRIINNESKFTESEITTNLHDLITLYQSNIGVIVPLLSEKLKEAATLYPAHLYPAAFAAAVAKNARNWAFVEACIKNANDGKEYVPRRTPYAPRQPKAAPIPVTVDARGIVESF